jgi:hypothetical protein
MKKERGWLFESQFKTVTFHSGVVFCMGVSLGDANLTFAPKFRGHRVLAGTLTLYFLVPTFSASVTDCFINVGFVF